VGQNTFGINKMKNKIIIFLIFILKSKIVGAQITNFSGSYNFSGSNLDQSEITFNLETTYPYKENITQLYRWRYFNTKSKGLIFEYNNRVYFGKDRYYDNSKGYWQGKVGYGLIQGPKYDIGTIPISDTFGNLLGYNNAVFEDKRHLVVNYGLALGYKFLLFKRVTFDLQLGYIGWYKQPNYSEVPNYIELARKSDWNNGLGYNTEFQWSLGFLLVD